MSDLQLRLQPVAGWPVVIAVAVVLVGLLFVRPRHVRLAVYQWAAPGGVAIGRRAADIAGHAATDVDLHQSRAATGIVGAFGRRLAEHASCRFAR